MTDEEAFEAEVSKLPKGAQQNIRDAMLRGESLSYRLFMAGVERGRDSPTRESPAS